MVLHRRIMIETVAPENMRFDAYRTPGSGDWFLDKAGNLVIQVCAIESAPNITGDVLHHEGFLVALHELIEAKLCLDAGMTQEMVDDFDTTLHDETEQLGDLPGCPYRTQHRKAMIVEHLMANFLGIDDYGVIS